MPHNFDFSKLENIKEIKVDPSGWVQNIYIEYGVGEDIRSYGAISYFWRVKGTQHTFVIPVVRMDFLSSGNYKKHFENVLENFKEDYINWKKEGFVIEWSKEYEKQFSRFIV